MSNLRFCQELCSWLLLRAEGGWMLGFPENNFSTATGNSTQNRCLVMRRLFASRALLDLAGTSVMLYRIIPSVIISAFAIGLQSLMGDIIAAILGGVILWGLLIAFCIYVVRTWLRWSRSDVKLGPPRWRSGIATAGFGASTASLTLIVGLGVHAVITGGFPYYSPPLMIAFRVGFLTALCGVVAAIIGKGQLEVPTIISSLLCLLIWFVEALAQ